MDSKEIHEGNRLIAVFMGRPYKFNRTKFSDGSAFEHEVLPDYHIRWDEIMNVVEKIEKDVSASIYYGFSVTITDLHCAVWCHEKRKQDGIIYQTPYGQRPSSKIVAVWDAVVQFIQWYNKNKTIK
jgi:hypothetical protein